MSLISSNTFQISWINFRLNWGHNMYPEVPSNLPYTIVYELHSVMLQSSWVVLLTGFFCFYLLESTDWTHQMTGFFHLIFKSSYLLLGHNMCPECSLRPPIHHCVRTTLSHASVFLSRVLLTGFFFFYLLESTDSTHKMAGFFSFLQIFLSL